MARLFVKALLLAALICPQSGAGQGKLFIIGGGSRPEAMRREMIRLGGLDRGRYAVILPMSSAEPDSSIYYGIQQFRQLGVPASQLTGFYLSREYCPQHLLDSLTNAGLIYLSGGVQTRFMDTIQGSPVQETLWKAYLNGAVIAGTSAGAAVMSQKMITGEQVLHPDDGGSFRYIESGNVELSTGLGFLKNAIVDQHFVYRMRHNRLITVVLENPGMLGIGIDEATAIVVDRDQATVVGDSQVILYQAKKGAAVGRKGTLLGSKDLKFQVLLPGDAFKIPK
ncbi:MAG: cyanophycinase [Haliscomenobacter sp.]|nr:cyanophycinase [Haliscomenobacter sp.]MBK7477982.1 cyanophycinase [Haliscomenobacter sp.]MBK8878274.1 cyanophycinase [Haliscomenobacter sp.]